MMFYEGCRKLYNQIIPMLYDDSLSFSELVATLKCAVIEVANENKETQKIIESFVARLDKIEASVDGKITDEVYKLLTEWKESGYLADIVQEVMQVPINQELPYQRLFRLLFETGRNSTFFGKENEGLENFGDYYALMQGCLFYKDENGVKKVACAMIPYGTEDTPFYTNNARLSIYDRAGTKINTTILPLEHANGIAYYQGKLYINGCYYYQNSSHDSSTGSGKVFIVNEADLTLIDTVDFPLVIQDVFVMNGEFYANAANSEGFGEIYKLNFEDKTVTKVLSLSPKIYTPTQSVYYANGNLYVATPDPYNGVSVYNATTGQLITRYALPQFGRDYTHVGEVQGCTYEDGKLLIGGSFNLGESTSQVRCNAFFEADPFRGLDYNYSGTRVTNGQTLIVDPDRKNAKNIKNPDGSPERPFKMINEAAVYVNAHPSHEFSIQLIGNTMYCCQFRTTKCVTIETPNTGGDKEKAKWTGNIFLEGGTFELSYLHIGQTVPSLNTDGYCVAINHCNLYCSSLDFHATSGNPLFGSAAYGLYCMHSNVVFSPTNYTTGQNWKEIYTSGDTMCVNAGRTSFINMSANNSE